MGDLAMTSSSAPASGPTRRRIGSVLVRGLIHRLRARDEVMPVETAIALAAAMARRIDDVAPRRVTPSSVLVFFDGTVELAESWAGTPEEMGYVPPEQLLAGSEDGGIVGAVFGVGAILYELLTGAAPFARADEAATRYAVLCEVPPPPSTVTDDIPAELDDILAVALAKD